MGLQDYSVINDLEPDLILPTGRALIDDRFFVSDF